jgi:ectoine hydroxylase-related dioxygenase (phytanoyl-CoA dioxygenase family)
MIMSLVLAAMADESCSSGSFDPTSLAKAKSDFETKGYAVLPNLLTAEECDEIEAMFDKLAHPTESLLARMGKDYGDQSEGAKSTMDGGGDPVTSLINVNNPARYLDAFSPNPLIAKVSSFVDAFLGEGATLDYEQLLEKVPKRSSAVFPWHQDMQYWPKRSAAPTLTATFSLALTNADEHNGCLRVIPGSGLARQLLTERADGGNASSSAGGSERAIVLPLTEAELAQATLLPVRRGDVTVHGMLPGGRTRCLGKAAPCANVLSSIPGSSRRVDCAWEQRQSLRARTQDVRGCVPRRGHGCI